MSQLLDRAEEYLGAVLLFVLVVLNFANIAGRYWLHTPMGRSEELVGLLLVSFSFIGVAAAARSGAHLGMSALTDHFPAAARRAVLLLGLACALLFFSLLLYFGVGMVLTERATRTVAPVTGLPMWLFGAVVPLSALLCLLRFVQSAVAAWKGVGDHHASSAPADY